MRKVYTFEASSLFCCNKEEYDNLIIKNSCWNDSFLFCAKNPFHKEIVGYERNCSKDDPEYLWAYRPWQHMMALNMIDADSPKFFSNEMIEKGLEFINKEMDSGRDVYVVCNQGQSRSPTMCLMYLMAHGDIPIDKSFSDIYHDYCMLVPEWNPRDGILQYCKDFWRNIQENE